jgi:predicted DNA-binding antitoxin AbrB/MazE fold protein
MSISVNAVYENGILKLEHPVELPEKARVHVVIEREVRPSRTALGGRLRELRSEILASGASALDWDQISEEVAARRGGYRENG